MIAENRDQDTYSIAMSLTSDGIEDDNVTSNGRGRIFDDIVHIVWTVDFAMLLLALVVGIVWLTYLTYYNARVIGFICTKVANCLHLDGRVTIGSLSVSLLSGKLMLANIVYFHRDFTFRIQYACVIFRYWRPYKYRRLGTDDFSHAEPRVLVEISGLELHVYNRVESYRDLDKQFGLGVFEFNPATGEDSSSGRLLQKGDTSNSLESTKWSYLASADLQKRRKWWSCWLTLIPRVDFSILLARLSFGNRLLPSTLAVSFDNAKARYSVKAPTNSLDEYLHVVLGSCENFKASLVKNADYNGVYEQPPRTMGEGFVVLQTSELEFYYYQDDTGVTPEDGVLHIASDSSAMPSPCWGSDLKLGKGTILSYGPWADAQRDKLYRFFFPPNFQTAPCFRHPPPGVRREFTKFDLKVSSVHDATIDLWFVPNDVPQAIHINICQGSYCDVTMPMIFEENGYVCTVAGQLMKVESSTSLAYRSLLSSETLEFNANLRYPRHWNEHVLWEFLLRGCKSAIWLVYEHKTFLQNLFNEWSSDDVPDICMFAPFTYVFECIFEDVEAVVTLNEHNWIDTSSNHEENCRGAISGRSLHLSFALPFVDFMPEANEFQFDFTGESLHLKLFFPEQHILSQPLRTLHSSAKQCTDRVPVPCRWKGPATSEDGWIECCYASRGVVTLIYLLHPIPARPSWLNAGDSVAQTSTEACSSLIPSNLDPDKIQVDIDVGPCCIHLSGAMVAFVLSLKENYFGETQTFMEVEKYDNETVERKCGFVNVDDFDVRKYRPLHVSVGLTLREIEAQCLTFDVGSASPSMLARTQKFVFEMDKQYTETRMQLCLSPVMVNFVDIQQGDDGLLKVGPTQDGQLLLTGFQLRGHALFSGEGLPLDSVTLEYGWLLEILLGDLIGRFTLKQMVQVIRFVKTFLQMISNQEEILPLPKYADPCQHMWPRSICPLSAKSGGSLCDTEHELKYRMIRLSLDRVQLCLFEFNSALELIARPLRLVHCTEHTATGKMGADFYLPYVSFKQFVKKELKDGQRNGHDIAATLMSRSDAGAKEETDKWVECGKIQSKMIILRFTAPHVDSSYYEKRREFLLTHDQRSRRLAFLHRSPRHDYTCGCVGGCVFFGDNRNGSNFVESFVKQSIDTVQRLVVPKLELDRSNPGYGQSILRNQELLTRGVCDLLIELPPIAEDASGSKDRIEPDRLVKSPNAYHETSDAVVDADEAAASRFGEEKGKDEERFSSMSASTSRSSSYVSTVSRNEDNTINLYYHVNRPIVCSRLLLSSYARYLDTYIGQKFHASSSSFTDIWPTPSDSCPVNNKNGEESKFVSFILRRRGLNDISFVPVTEETADEEERKLCTSDIVRERKERRAAIIQSEDNETTTISDLQNIDANLEIGDHCQVFFSPLAVEMIEQYLTAWMNECKSENPVSLAMDAFSQCSNCEHQQAIVSTDEDTKEFDYNAVPIRFTADIPRIDITVFQCGIVEKIVPFSHLEHATSLMPASIFVICLERLSTRVAVEKVPVVDGGPKRRSYTASAGFEHSFFHLTQIVEKGAATVGISKNASNIARWVCYDALNVNSNDLPCVVLEGKVVFVDFFVQKMEQKERTAASSLEASPMETKPNETRPPDISMSNQDNGSETFKNQLDGLVGCVSVHVGLLQPLEHSGSSWPLYDLLAPSTSSWLHVAHRFTSTLTLALEALEYGRSGPFCFLLTEALYCDQSFSIRKSKFEKLKLRRKYLHECPSCQTLLALMRYCVSEDFSGFERRSSLPAELKDSMILKSAMVALLSHWREALCANKFVRLNVDAAKPFVVTSPSIEERKIGQETSVVIDVDDEMRPSSPTTPDLLKEINPTNALQPQAAKSRIESLQNLAAKFERFELEAARDAAAVTPSLDVEAKAERISAPTTATFKRLTQMTSGNNLKVAGFPPVGTGGGIDLYEWMKREQAGYTKTKKRKQSRYRKLSGDAGDEINPMDVPLYVYFGFLFEYLKLKRSRRKSPIFVILGHDFVADFNLHRVVATVNEPKYLGLAGSTLKRVTHTERPLIGIHKLALRADAKYSEERMKETSLSTLPGSKEDASPPKQAVQSVDYHVNVLACDVTVGFPSVNFINQVVYVIRSTRETFEELHGRRKTCDDEQMKNEQNGEYDFNRQSTSLAADLPSERVQLAAGTMQTEKSEQEKESGIGCVDERPETNDFDVDAIPPVTAKKGGGCNIPSGFNKQQQQQQRGSDVEKGEQSSISVQSNPQQHWSKRMLTMLRDFQRAKKTSVRRQTPTTPTPSTEAILVTKVLGAIDCDKVEINAIFTELFAYATFKSVQFGHKSTESWTAVGPSQLRSSDKSVRGAVKQINLTLSEAQSLQAVPLNVLTLSVAESHAIFRRYLHLFTLSVSDPWRNSLGVEIGPIHVDIPLHAGSLHGLVVRGTKNISDRLPFLMTPSVVEEVVHIKKESSIGHYSRKFDEFEKLAVIHFKMGVKEFLVDAALLPSLEASYKMTDVMACGETGSEAKFQIKVPSHEMAFDMKGIPAESLSLSVAPKILVAFPNIDAKGAYVHHQQRPENSERTLNSDILYKEGGYLQIDVEVGAVQHTLTTDLLNQLLFIQEGFTSEIGDIIQKIRSEKKPATFWSSSTSATKKQLLYSIEVNVSAVQIMATTPTATAVRLDSENVRFQISNRLLRKTKGDALERVFGVTELNISLSLGQLVRVASHQEAEQEFQQFGYFKTGVGMRNVASSDGTDGHHEPDASADGSGNTYLVTLSSPVIFAQPTAVDKALLIWLNYKNAYEFWNEQRSQIKSKAAKSIFDSRQDPIAGVVGGGSIFEQLTTPPLLVTKSLFLQVAVENGLYICVPLYGVRPGGLLRSVDVTTSALVVSLRNTSIAVCSHGALVCRGRFNEFGLRFVEDFDGNAESWNPAMLDTDDPTEAADINSCFVPEGTYDICSKTINPTDDRSTARWILNISWKMKGFDMNLNTRIWKLTSLLVSTLTSLATTETDDSAGVASSSRASLSPEERPDSAVGDYAVGFNESAATATADELTFIASMGPGRNRRRVLQKTYHDVVARIRTLEQQEADELLIEKERKKLLRVEQLLFSDSRRDVVTKLRRQAQKATTSLIDQWGLNVKTATTDEDAAERSKQKRQPRPANTETSSTQQHQNASARRYSEFPARNLARQQMRIGSIDTGGGGGGGYRFSHLRQLSESGTPSPADLTLSFDLGDCSTDLFNESPGDRSRSQSPGAGDNGNRRATTAPKVLFEKPLQFEKTGTSSGAVTSRPQPPAVDLYLDISIFVENGQCNFRSTISKLLEQQQELTAASSSAAAAASRKQERESKQRRHKTNSGRSDKIRQSSQQPVPVHTTTVFLPGLNVKASYASSSGGATSRPMHGGESESVSRTSSIEFDGTAPNLLGGKHGQLIVWMSLEEMPEETVISPHILDFLEQMLEPVTESAVSTLEPGSVLQRKPSIAETASKSREDLASAAQNSESGANEQLGFDASTLATVASFPLDIVFHLNVQSSQIRFTSQPLAQIECILRLPTLQLIGTSRKCSELVIPSGSHSETSLKRTLSSSAMLFRQADDDLSGGIFVTVLLTGFSVSVFHMYSAGARAGTVSSATLEKRDALCIHMDKVGISLSRSRIAIGDTSVSTSNTAPGLKIRSAPILEHAATSTAGAPQTSRPNKNSVKVSLVINMGKAHFKYDMRRLHEILQFPKAWYRRTIFRRLFLGDEITSNSRAVSTPSVSSLGAACVDGRNLINKEVDANARIDLETRLRKRSKASASSSLTSDEDDEEEEEEEDDDDDVMTSFPTFRKRASRSPAASSNRSSWDALVVFGVNFEELSIEAMMGQVMGETKWVFAGVDSQGHFALTSDKNKSVYVAFRLARSELVARQGQVSGLMNLAAFEAAAFVKKCGRSTPQSTVNASLECLDMRIDWMSSPIFMARLMQLNCSLKDDWRIEENSEGYEKPAYVEQVSVLLMGKVSWDSFRILITQTTVTDIIRVFYKVNEFIDQSLQSGRMALSLHTTGPFTQSDRPRGQQSTHSGESGKKSDQTAVSNGQSQPTVVKRYHHHWQKALAVVTSLQLEAADFFPIPRNATVLGGAVEFSGSDLALACFGINFHSKEWLVFHLREPCIEFSTEAKDICLDNDELAQLINQDLCFRLGQRQLTRISTHMGTVLCVTGAYAATHSSSIDEWLAHAFTSVLNRVYRVQSPVPCKHQYKEAFYIPPFAMHVKTKQIQAASHLAIDSTSRPIVEASVIADFEDHLKINVQEVLYLRRFIKAYISRQTEASAAGGGDRTRQVADPTQELQKDAREYRTTNWHVEPTIRLMSLESMETTDYLWQILGIYQYAATVSKWLQRGFLDPLDSVVASLMEQILTAEKKSKEH